MCAYCESGLDVWLAVQLAGSRDASASSPLSPRARVAKSMRVCVSVCCVLLRNAVRTLNTDTHDTHNICGVKYLMSSA